MKLTARPMSLSDRWARGKGRFSIQICEADTYCDESDFNDPTPKGVLKLEQEEAERHARLAEKGRK